MISKTENMLVCIGNLSDIAAEMDGVSGSPIQYKSKLTLSEELRRERVKLFGKSGLNQQKRYVYANRNDVKELLRNIFVNIQDPWPYITQLAGYIEAKTSKSIVKVCNKSEPSNFAYGKSFVIILRYGFGIKRRHICEYLNISKFRCDWICDNVRDSAIYSPEFNEIFVSCLEYTEQIISK